MYRIWTSNEIETLENEWGSVSIKRIADKLDRTEYAVIRKAKRLKLGSYYKEYLTCYDVARMVGLDSHCIDRWINKGLKHKRIYFGKVSKKYIELGDLVKFLKDNQKLWNSNKLELYALGEEPSWLKEKRKKDNKERARNEYKNWTEDEERKLLNYRVHYDIPEIAAILGRTNAAIIRKLTRIKNGY